MIIQQTTHIVFEYPQDYLQEQEWCKTKTDEWIHVGTDTRCSIYENKISYSIGQPNCSEKPNNSTISKMEQVEDEPQTYVINPQEPTNDDKCFDCDDFFTCGGQCNKIEDEPQTERSEE